MQCPFRFHLRCFKCNAFGMMQSQVVQPSEGPRLNPLSGGKKSQPCDLSFQSDVSEILWTVLNATRNWDTCDVSVWDVYMYIWKYMYMSRIYMQAYVKCICNVGLHEARCIFIVWGFLPLFVLCGLQLVSCEMFLFESSLLSINRQFNLMWQPLEPCKMLGIQNRCKR